MQFCVESLEVVESSEVVRNYILFRECSTCIDVGIRGFFLALLFLLISEVQRFSAVRVLLDFVVYDGDHTLMLISANVIVL